jgi:uncharacterized phage protein gp47/JayE
LQAYENDTSTTDPNGIPSHSISLVVEGGDATEIADAIAAKKTPGAGTFGTTSETVTDAYGLPHPIHFFRPADVAITVGVAITALSGYTSGVGASIQNAVANYINALAIGQKVMLSRIYLPANLNGSSDGATYEITGLTLNGSVSDISIAFNEVATCAPGSVSIAVT